MYIVCTRCTHQTLGRVMYIAGEWSCLQCGHRPYGYPDTEVVRDRNPKMVMTYRLPTRRMPKAVTRKTTQMAIIPGRTTPVWVEVP